MTVPNAQLFYSSPYAPLFSTEQLGMNHAATGFEEMVCKEGRGCVARALYSCHQSFCRRAAMWPKFVQLMEVLGGK